MLELPKDKEGLVYFIKNLPQKPGIYKFIDLKRKPIYIGKAKNIKKRVSQYFKNLKTRTTKLNNLISESVFLDITLTNSELEALLLEQYQIKKSRPKFNVQFKDDKGYPWLRVEISKKFPGVSSYLGKKNDKEDYFGPYPSSYAAKEALSVIQKTFKLRNCSDSFFKNRSRPCMQFEIGRCSAPCVGHINHSDYMKEVKNAQRLLQGKADDLIEEFYSTMDNSSINQMYERAALYRDKISSLRDIQRNQSIAGFKKDKDALSVCSFNGITKIGLTHVKGGWITSHQNFIQENVGLSEPIIKNFIKSYYLSDNYCPSNIIVNEDIIGKIGIEEALSSFHKKSVKIITRPGTKDKGLLQMAISNTKFATEKTSVQKKDLSESMNLLKNTFNLNKKVELIESYDISHHSGSGAVASCVVYSKLGKVKGSYRLFNISKANKGNDIASMKEVIERRFESKSLNLQRPTHILIDGGKTHLEAVNQSLKKLNILDIELLAISKGARRKADHDSIHRMHKKVSKIIQGSVAHLFIQEIRDETHRFAINSQKKKQIKLSMHSSLDEAHGIGQKKKKLLLRYFGSMEQIERAGIQDLVNVPLIGEKTAKLIYNHLH